MHETKYDELIKVATMTFFPELIHAFGDTGWLWIKAQIMQESSFNRFARSKAGAKGLMQLMPATAKQMGVDNPYDPEQNIEGGVKYLAIQFRAMGEIPTVMERLKFAFASYNGGRGYINKALSIAREDEGLPGSFAMWKIKGSPIGKWQLWDLAKVYLYSPLCRKRGRKPDALQMINYVRKIISIHSTMEVSYGGLK